MPLLAPSASFAVFSNWMQPLADCMFKLQVAMHGTFHSVLFVLSILLDSKQFRRIVAEPQSPAVRRAPSQS